MKRLTCSQVVASVFVLGWAVCPMAFALERGKQEGKRATREIASRVVGAEGADSLVDQIGAMQIGRFVTVGNVDGAVSVELNGATYVFNQIASDADGFSSLVEEYRVKDSLTDSVEQRKTGEFDFTNITATDDNTIEFSVVATTRGLNWVEHGALFGVPSEPGMAVASVSVNGGDPRLSLVDFGGFATVDSAVSAPTLALPIVTSFAGQPSSQGGAAFFLIDDLVGFVVALVIALVIVLFVAVTCLALGWFGCEGSWWWTK